MNFSKGRTFIDNSIIHDKNLKCNEKEVFNIIRSLETIPNFKTSKGLISKEIQKSYRTTQNILSSLREKGLVFLKRVRDGKRWVYYYVTKFFEEVEEAPKKVAKKVAKKEVAPKVETQLDGQIELEEAMESVKNDDIDTIANKCIDEGLNATREQMEEALQITNEKSPKNPIAYTLGVLRNMVQNRKSNVNQGFKKSLSHMNFSQREYDNWNELEEALLYGVDMEDSVSVETNNDIPQLPSFIGSNL